MFELDHPELTWLVACERSGILRDALIEAGHSAISCDIYPSRRPGPHYQGDVRDIIHKPWGGMVAHPVCRYLANSGVQWLYRGGYWENGIDPVRWALMLEGVEFYKVFDNAVHIPLRAVENPVMHEYAAKVIGHRADQFVHPGWFGSPFQKATGFKLYNLPKLPKERTKESYGDLFYNKKNAKIVQRVFHMGKGADALGRDREERRSETDAEVARAIAQYWGDLIYAR